MNITVACLLGATLLLDCLKLATVGNRREIEERLLLPAGQWLRADGYGMACCDPMSPIDGLATLLVSSIIPLMLIPV